MRKALTTAVVGLMLFGGCGLTNESKVKLHLSCESQRVQAKQPYQCEITLRNPPAARPIVVPRMPVPFPIPNREAMVLTFETRTGGTWRDLEVAGPAKRGRYDLGPLTADGLLVLRSGEIHGWVFDLNGSDWEFPFAEGKYEIRARLNVGLLPKAKSTPLSAPLREVLGKWADQAGDVVLDGDISSNILVVERQN